MRNLGSAPWPYGVEDARAFLAGQSGNSANFLICERAGGRIVGGIGFGPYEDHANEFGYWITPDRWGLGYATEAGRAVIAVARAVGVKRLDAGHFLDNPASGRVLTKLGFTPTGTTPRFSRGRGTYTPCADFVLDLADCMSATDRLAA